MTIDTEHKFDLALHLGELKVAHELAIEAEVPFCYFVLAFFCLSKNSE